jgi:hypothetical protein
MSKNPYDRPIDSILAAIVLTMVIGGFVGFLVLEYFD